MINLNDLPIAQATVRPISFGGLLTPPLGGPVQRIDRLGDRWAWTFETAPMRIGNPGRYWLGMLQQARKEGARLKVSQPELPDVDWGTPLVKTAAASGRIIAVKGLTPGVQVYRGQWLSFFVDDHRYLDMNLGDVIADGAGEATLLISNLLRVPLSIDTPIELAAPEIEGWIAEYDEWTIARSRTVQMTFTITEAE